MKKTSSELFHRPVLLKQAVEYLAVKAGQLYVDATVGGGGHSLAILKQGGRLFGLDWDPEAVDFAKQRLQSACPSADWQIVKADFADLESVLAARQLCKPAGILFDLGPSLHQLTSQERGFSFSQNGPLDMRMRPELKVSAADLINGLHKGELNELFSKLGEEKLALPIAKAVVKAREKRPIRTTGRLAKIVSRVYRRYYQGRSRIHPATQVFLALRIAVNDELNNIEQVLPAALRVLKAKGRLVVISFHGLEDKIVKQYFKKKQQQGRLTVLTEKPVVADQQEIKENPGARSAKLRCAEKTTKTK